MAIGDMVVPFALDNSESYEVDIYVTVVNTENI